MLSINNEWDIKCFKPLDFLMPRHRILSTVLKDCALKLEIPEALIDKFQVLMLHADLDTDDKTCTFRASLLLRFWKLYLEGCRRMNTLCRESKHEQANVGVVLLNHSFHMWFSPTWQIISERVRKSLIQCVRQGFKHMPLMRGINLEYLLKTKVNQCSNDYTNRLFANNDKSAAASNDHKISIATYADFVHFSAEGLPLSFLRLLKLFDGRCMRQVEIYTERLLATLHNYWTTLDWENCGKTKADELDCLVNICHIYIMVVYESDDQRGTKIDEMIESIRLHFDSLVLKKIKCSKINFKENTNLMTPANLIALTCYRLKMDINIFFKLFIQCKNVSVHPTLYGIIGQAYGSYLLGNILVDMSLKKRCETQQDIDNFLEIFKHYVQLRGRSEEMIQEEIRKSKVRYARPIIKNENYITIFEDHINKGNRNQGLKLNIYQEGSEPVFINLPSSLDLLAQLHEIISKQTNEVWYFGKVIILLKLIAFQWNEIEMFRYQLGLGAEFMLNLHNKLSKYFEYLALVLEDHHLIAQEIWLTAFSLNPTKYLFAQVSRAGITNKRRDKQENIPAAALRGNDIVHTQQLKLEKDAKYQLLSSTIDVTGTVMGTSKNDVYDNYNLLYNLLGMMRLPNKYIKDILTACFAARAKDLFWATDWNRLQMNCKKHLTDRSLKRNHAMMDEDYDKFDYLDVDYDKYKNRPQLDYGCIETGYEKEINESDVKIEGETDEEEEFVSSDEDYTDVELIQAKRRRKELSLDNPTPHEKPNEQQKVLEQIESMVGENRPRTRARVAQASQKANAAEVVIATVKEYEIDVAPGNGIERNADINFQQFRSKLKVNDEEAVNTVVDNDQNNTDAQLVFYSNDTPGFKPICNIWHENVRNLGCCSLQSYKCVPKHTKSVLSYVALEKYINKMKSKVNRNCKTTYNCAAPSPSSFVGMDSKYAEKDAQNPNDINLFDTPVKIEIEDDSGWENDLYSSQPNMSSEDATIIKNEFGELSEPYQAKDEFTEDSDMSDSDYYNDCDSSSSYTDFDERCFEDRVGDRSSPTKYEGYSYLNEDVPVDLGNIDENKSCLSLDCLELKSSNWTKLFKVYSRNISVLETNNDIDIANTTSHEKVEEDKEIDCSFENDEQPSIKTKFPEEERGIGTKNNTNNTKDKFPEMISIMTCSLMKIMNISMISGLDPPNLPFNIELSNSNDYLKKFILKKILNENQEIAELTSDDINYFKQNTEEQILSFSKANETPQNLSEDSMPNNKTEYLEEIESEDCKKKSHEEEVYSEGDSKKEVESPEINSVSDDETFMESQSSSSSANISCSKHKQCQSIENIYISSNEDTTSSTISVLDEIIVPYSPNWQPQVNVKRLKVVQGHIIRKCQVRVKRLSVERPRPRRRQGKSRCLCGC